MTTLYLVRFYSIDDVYITIFLTFNLQYTLNLKKMERKKISWELNMELQHSTGNT